jgi:preprotein translocase subunit Sec61beta
MDRVSEGLGSILFYAVSIRFDSWESFWTLRQASGFYSFCVASHTISDERRLTRALLLKPPGSVVSSLCVGRLGAHCQNPPPFVLIRTTAIHPFSFLSWLSHILSFFLPLNKQATQRRAAARAGGGGGGQRAGNNILQFYTDDSPGLQIGPTTVLIASLSFVGSVVVLHIIGKFRS